MNELLEDGNVEYRQKLRLLKVVSLFADVVSRSIHRLIVAFLISGKYVKKTWQFAVVIG